jgi:hypothetical protein
MDMGLNMWHEHIMGMGSWWLRNLQLGCGMAARAQCRRVVLASFSHTTKEALKEVLGQPRVCQHSNLVHECNESCGNSTFCFFICKM